MTFDIYNFDEIEKKWNGFFASYMVSNDELIKNKKNKYYVLSMLPYPSGKLHMGHVRNYTIGDVVSRYKKMTGLTVIQPIGWDSFGMPAENAAIKSGGHPKTWTENNIVEMKIQLKKMGYMYDWSREISTCAPEYYSQEQKIFLDMFAKGLIYRKKSYVNWDPVDQTVLANEQVIDGRGWRSGALVQKKKLEQWSVKITYYAEQLLEDLQQLKGFWPDNVLKMQENWIGKSCGLIISFKISDSQATIANDIPVFTTRPDTIFGASFVALSVDHEISTSLAQSNHDISAFVDECKKTITTEESMEKAEKKGIHTGLFVNHPVIDGEKIPVYIANFVLMEYGTGAVFGCPAHDERDFEFAQKYNLPIKRVIDSDSELPHVGEGAHINSSYLDGMKIDEAKTFIIDMFEKQGIGTRKIMYRLRDWSVSRQRYWGCPIPIVHCPKCGCVPSALPVLLPDDAVLTGGGNPLEQHDKWKNVQCPICNEVAVRDTDTLDTFFESSWYFLRYLSPRLDAVVDRDIVDAGMPVDICVGGVEHAVLHLLYARFFMLALKDMGYISSHIPFQKLLTQGMVCHKSYKNSLGEWVYPDDICATKDGRFSDQNGNEVFEHSFEKMSKSKKNTISPEKIIDSYGVDAVRLFIVSDTPPEKSFDWNTDALDGAARFLKKVWKIFNRIVQKKNTQGGDELVKTAHIYLKKIKHSYELVALNKSVALSRELFNEIEKHIEHASSESLLFSFEIFVRALYPVCPHIAHEMWERLGHHEKLQEALWPQINEKLYANENITIAVQVNGKLRKTFETAPNASENELKEMALSLFDASLAVKKVIVVRNKIVNIVLLG